MKICLVSLEYPPETGGGGIGTQTYLKAQGLSARGHEVHVVSTSWDGQAREYADGRATIHRIPEVKLDLPGYETSTYWLAYSWAVAGKLHALAQAVAFDIIQFPEYGGEGFMYQSDTFRYRTAKYVVQMHGPLAMFRDHMGWPERGSTLDQVGCFMERTVLHHADAWLASSHCTAAFCAKLYDLDLPKIHVIHSALDIGKFAVRPAPPDDRFPKILFVGNFTGSKGLPSLIEAVIRLKEKFPRIHLRAIGKGDAAYIGTLQKRIAAGNAQANIDLKGYVPYAELPAQYAWCDFFAGPSEYEPGPGNVYLEAMACGRPVIAGNTGGAPEVVRPGQTGLLVPPLQVEPLAEAVTRLATDAPLRQRFGEQARAWILEQFTIEKYIDRVETIYRELVERK